MALTLATTLKYYKRPEIQEALILYAEDKEVAVRFGDKGFGKRPDMLTYPKDVLLLAQKGATSFHCSEELWQNPLGLIPGVKKQDLDENRKGWDLILDIDCASLEFSKIGADLVIQALQHEEIESISVKFSGNHGFHIAVPFEALPHEVNGIPTKDWFPEGPRKIASYLSEKIRPFLKQALLDNYTMKEIVEGSQKPRQDLVKNGEFDPFEVLKIDTVLISSRHLYRMPYSLHEKSGLASIPLPLTEVRNFDKMSAVPELVEVKNEFLRREPGKQDARKLLVKAFDWEMQEVMQADTKEKTRNLKKEYEPLTEKIPAEYFPDCIKQISAGMKDGKKRGMFILTNFLQSVGWNPEEIDDYLREWNKRNPEPLREVLIVGQVRYLKQRKTKALPPNCNNKAYYQDLGIKCPNCRYKNPVTAAIVRQKMAGKQNKKQDKPKSRDKKQ